MTLQVFAPRVLAGYQRDVVGNVATARFAGAGEQRAQLDSRAYYRWILPVAQTAAERDAAEAFLDARGWSKESFLWGDPLFHARSGVALGTAIAAQVAFPIPDLGVNGGDYPIDDAHVVVYEDAAPTAAAVTVDTDTRTFTLDSAPGAGVVVTADYHYYRRVKAMPSSLSSMIDGLYRGNYEFVEVPA